MPLHKGNQKRIYFEGAVYFVTNHTKDWHRFFEEPIFCEVFIANLRLCKIMHKFSLYAFIVILHHFHLLFMPHKAEDLPKIMQFLKRHITRDINFILGHNPENNEGAISESLLRAGISEKFLKYKEIIEKHKAEVISLRKQFIKKYGENQNIFPKFQWEKSYRDHYIRNNEDFEEHVKYIYNNPFKHKIPNAENYKYIFTNYPELINEFLKL